MKAFLFAAFVCFAAAQSHAQENIIVWNESAPLQWLDFTGTVNAGSPFDAESFAEVRYSYKFNNSNDFHFEVVANFDKKTSWCKKEYRTQALLKHEQLHFDIAALYSKKLKEAFDNYRYSNDYENEINQIFNQQKNDYHAMQKKYDEETSHSLNKEKQNDWEKFIFEQLSTQNARFNYAKK
jgi:hypothetical protein